MAVGFFLVFGNDTFDLSGSQVGLLTGVLIGSQAVSNLIWGWIGDRIGHKLVLTGSALAMALAALCAWVSVSFVIVVVAFVLLGISLGGDSVSKFNIILEFATPQDQPTYIGLTNTLLAPVISLAPILGGLLDELSGAVWCVCCHCFIGWVAVGFMGTRTTSYSTKAHWERVKEWPNCYHPFTDQSRQYFFLLFREFGRPGETGTGTGEPGPPAREC